MSLNRWALIDFRRDSLAVDELRENFWHVCYSEDYSTAIAKRLNNPDMKITLRGDEIYPFDVLPKLDTGS